MIRIERVSRRGFLEGLFSAGALILSVRVLPAAESEADAAAFHPSVYLGIDTDGTVRIVAHRSEMGTGVKTSLPMIVAEELDADWKRVKVEQAVGDPKYGSQNTDGSASIRDFYEAMREAGATGRLMLERAAAGMWGVSPGECKAELHTVVSAKGGKKAGFGELAALAAKQAVPAKSELRFKNKSEYRYVGKGVPIVDIDDIVTGRAMFGQDAAMPGMLYASIERCPVIGGAVKGVDDTATLKVSGVRQTVAIDPFKPPCGFQPLGGIAVIADNTWAAMQGRKKLKVEWDLGANASYDSAAFRREMSETARKPGKVLRNAGDVEKAFVGAAKVHEAEYYTPLLSHAPMEPPAAVAHFRDGKVETWTATQNPQAVQETVAAAVGIKKEDVLCHVTLLGGGFGRKSKPDYVAEAAVLSKKAGRPVKVVWSREDDIQFDYYHSTAAMYLKAGLDKSGKPVAWLNRSVFPTISSTFVNGAEYGGDGEMAMGWTDVPFAIPNIRTENGAAKNHVRIGWLRSVANIYHVFGVQSFMHELAHEAGQDPLEYWLKALGPDRRLDFSAQGVKDWNYSNPVEKYPFETARLRRVMELAAERGGYAKFKSGGGRGMAVVAHRSFLCYVAAAVQVEVDHNGQVTIPRVDYAVDAGRIIHPERVRNQFEGAAVFGVSAAMMGEVTATNGRIVQSNFHNYPVARIHQAPREVHVHLVASDAIPVGTGEPGVPPIAPALCNAIFAATGKRARELPVKRVRMV